MYLFDFTVALDTKISIRNMFNASKLLGKNLFTPEVWLRLH